MTDLTVRQIDFDVDETDFIWNPANPAFSVLMNQITFFVVGFERYMCRVMRDAEARIADPAVMEEAVAFRMQEAIHPQKHNQHTRGLFDMIRLEFESLCRMCLLRLIVIILWGRYPFGHNFAQH